MQDGMSDKTLRGALAAYADDSAGYYAALRRLGGRHGVFWDDDLRAWVVTGNARCRALLTSPLLSKSRLRLDGQGLSPHLQAVAQRAQSVIDRQMTFDESPSAVRSHRDWTQLLHTGRTDRLAHDLAHQADTIWHAFAEHGPDFYRTALRPYVSRAVAAKLRLDEPARAALYPAIYGYADFLDGKSASGSVAGAAVSVVLLSDFVAARFDDLARCAVNPIGDVGRWIADYVLTLVAGHESTAYALAVALLAACERSDALRSPLAIRQHLLEALRFDSPIQLVGRIARAAIDLEDGKAIRAGERVFLHIGAAHRDPARFEAPDQFCLGRAGGDLLAFGLGASRCVGMNLSLLQAQIFLGAAGRFMATRHLAAEAVTCAHGLAGRSFDRLSLVIGEPRNDRRHPPDREAGRCRARQL